MQQEDYEESCAILKSFADDNYEPTVSLKQSIDVEKLCSTDLGGGIEFEVDEEHTNGGDLLPDYHSENVHEYLNIDALGMQDESEVQDDEYIDHPFEAIGKDMHNLTDDGGVKKKILSEGLGNTVPLNMEVVVHYSAYLEHGDEPFDSTRLRDRPFRYVLGCGEMIEGLELGLSTMKKNEEAQFLIKSNYAFGNRGVPPRIPANASLLFRVELLNWVEASEMHNYFKMSREDRRVCDFKLVKNVAHSFLEGGNDKHKQGRYGTACKLYYKGVRAIEDYHPADEEVEKAYHKLLIRLYQNSCIANMKLNNLGAVRYNADKALIIDPNCVKALYYMGKAQRQCGDFDQAIVTLRKAQTLEPKNKVVTNELVAVNRCKATIALTHTAMCRRMFGNAPKKTGTKNDPQKTNVGSSSYTEAKLTDEFKENVQSDLNAFKQTDVLELPLPCDHLTLSERDYIKKISMEYDLEFKEKGEGSNLHIRICKKRFEQL